MCTADEDTTTLTALKQTLWYSCSEQSERFEYLWIMNVSEELSSTWFNMVQHGSTWFYLVLHSSTLEETCSNLPISHAAETTKPLFLLTRRTCALRVCSFTFHITLLTTVVSDFVLVPSSSTDSSTSVLVNTVHCTHNYVSPSLSLSACIYIYTCVYVNVYVYVYPISYIYIYIYIHM